MEKKTNNSTTILVIIALILLALCLFLSCFAGGLVLYGRITRSSQPMNLPVQQEPPSLVPADEQTDEENLLPSPESPLNTVSPVQPHALTDQQKLIVERAEAIRRLSSEEPVELVFRSRESLKEYLVEELQNNTAEEEYQQDHDLLNLLGFIPKDFDLKSFYLEMYSENISGFYDSDTNQMNLVDDGSEIENSLTLAHEYTHFLIFNNFDPEKTLNYSDEACEKDPEACFIISSVMEGDASLTEILLSAEPDLNLREGAPSGQGTSVLETAPKYFLDSVLFPYTEGLNFVSQIYRDGGMDAVNQLYKNPPASIEQILHPERYPNEQPVTVTLDQYNRALDRQCSLVRESTLNEADLKWILTSAYDEKWRIPEKNANRAVDGWGGGTFRSYSCGENPLFFARVVWDSDQDAQEFEEALGRQFSQRFGNPQSQNAWTEKNGMQAFIQRDADMVSILIAPDSFDSKELLNLLDSGISL